jgi:ribosomal protein L31E
MCNVNFIQQKIIYLQSLPLNERKELANDLMRSVNAFVLTHFTIEEGYVDALVRQDVCEKTTSNLLAKALEKENVQIKVELEKLNNDSTKFRILASQQESTVMLVVQCF